MADVYRIKYAAAYADRVVTLPGIVAEQSGQQPDRDQDQQGKARERQRDA